VDKVQRAQRGTLFPHLQKMAQGVHRPQIFCGRREKIGGKSWRRNLRWLYTVIVPGYNICFCISNASQSDRAKSKLEYCWATWLQKQLGPWGPMTTAAGPTTTNRGPDPPSVQFPHLRCSTLTTGLVTETCVHHGWEMTLVLLSANSTLIPTTLSIQVCDKETNGQTPGSS